MKKSTLLSLAILLFSSTGFTGDYEFFPPSNKRLVYEFKGVTQNGIGTHKIEILQLGYRASFNSDEKIPTDSYYLIYYAGEEYGPEILHKIPGHSPYLKVLDERTIEIQFTLGNNGHIKQTWEMKGFTAELTKEEEISFKERKYLKTK